MRIFNWVQNKLSGKQEKKTVDTPPAASARHDWKEEFGDWPQSLLVIGTFGNNNELNKDPQRHRSSENEFMEDPQGANSMEDSDLSQDFPDFTPEEVHKLQKELTKLLNSKSKKSTDHGSDTGGNRANLPLDRFLNCPSSLEIDRRVCLKLCDDLGNGDNGSLSPNTKMILSKLKDTLADSRNAIRQKSFSFLLKKMFICRGGFPPPHSLRDPIPESRLEKLLRTLLHKKIYPQNSARTSMKKQLGNKPTEKIQAKEKMEEKEEDRCKWVKTDSEYIVLEM